jgi:antitoxin PrlF
MAGRAVREPYHAKATTVGNSRALQLEAGLVRAHPELAEGRFDVHVVAPGTFLVVASETSTSTAAEDEDDPILGAFLGFLNQQMQQNPGLLRPLLVEDVQRLEELVHGVADTDESLDDDFVMP